MIEANPMIDCPIEQVWKFVIDLSNFPVWNPRLLEMRQTFTGPQEVGTTIQSTHPGQRVLDEKIVAFVPSDRITLESTSRPIKGSSLTFSLEALEGKTRLIRITERRLSGFCKMIEPFASFRARQDILVEIRNVRRILESQATLRQEKACKKQKLTTIQ
jgi:hypothetical protein